MAEKKLVICDTNILIEYFKENIDILERLSEVGYNNLSVSAVSAGEMYFGAINKSELAKIKKVIDKLILFSLNEQIGERFENLMYEYALSHTLSIPDALIAATALHHDIRLYTLNTKDFKFIKGLKLYKP